MGIANDYTVVLTLTNKETGEVQKHTIDNEAYNMDESLRQALYELDAKFGFLEQQNLWKLRILSISPKTVKSSEILERLLQEIGLLKLPTLGTKS